MRCEEAGARAVTLRSIIQRSAKVELQKHSCLRARRTMHGLKDVCSGVRAGIVMYRAGMCTRCFRT